MNIYHEDNWYLIYFTQLYFSILNIVLNPSNQKSFLRILLFQSANRYLLLVL